jgi:hypothetical protein
MSTSPRRTETKAPSPKPLREPAEETNHPAEQKSQVPHGGDNGRDPRGRFTAGNPGGPGNPFARQVAALRSALVRRVTEEDIEQIAAAVVTQAKMGNLAATKLLFRYGLGKPAEVVNPDTLDIQEWRQLYQPLPRIMKELPRAMVSLPAEVACGMVESVQPIFGQELAKEIRPTPEEIANHVKESARSVKEETASRARLPWTNDRKTPSANGSEEPSSRATPPSTNSGDGTDGPRHASTASAHEAHNRGPSPNGRSVDLHSLPARGGEGSLPDSFEDRPIGVFPARRESPFRHPR